jgi:hypothetical protein
MEEKNILGMKNLIAEKKKKSAQQSSKNNKPTKQKISQQKAFHTRKQGGCFDK